MSLKSDILLELRSNSGSYLSGQYLAEKFGVSRNAVWKAINQIKSDGYAVASVNNKGYCLSGEPDFLSADEIKGYMSDSCAKNTQLFVFDEIDSTNNEAKRMIANGLSHNALIAANSQTGGRGRLGRSFYSPKNTGIYMSYVFHPNIKISNAVPVTTAASVAVVRAVEKLTDIKPSIKWVNDIYLNGKKICGILTEAITDFESEITHSVVVGIGINITTDDFPDEISNIAASLNPVGVPRGKIIVAVAEELSALCSDLSDKSYIAEYREHSMVIGKAIDYYKNNVKYSGTAANIDNEGGLVVLKSDGTLETLHSGEITVRLAEY